MKAIDTRLTEIIDIIENKPGFIFAPNESSYTEIKYFLYGYLGGLGDNLNISFSKWLNGKYKKTSLMWTEYIFLVLAGKDEEKAVKILLMEIKDFIKNNNQ